MLALILSVSISAAASADAPEIRFDHIHTYQEVVSYLEAVVDRYPEITQTHKIGKSYLGKDLLVLEITNRATGNALEKPGYFIDGNLHAGEVIGGEICLNTIHTLVTRYGEDPVVTELVDTRAFYILPKLNPDGSDHAITQPDSLRSVVRPFDDDGDGRLDEDPPDDLDGDGFITRMRIRDENGPLKTSPEDARLMVSREQGVDPESWKGEWRVYTEGIDNDNDGELNEDGVGGLDINRNFPDQWHPDPLSFHPGPYPLSEPESRAVADFLLAHTNLTGHINYHMSGNVAVYPPSNLRTDPISGDIVRQPFPDENLYKRFGAKAVALIDNAKIQVFKIHGASPATWHGSIWGVYADWVYHRLGIFSWIFEVGIYPGVTDIFPSYGKEIERLRWSDANRAGKLFVDWKPYDHPQLGKVEIGGFLNKIYDANYQTYTNVMCLPGPDYERLLENHTKWHLYLMMQSPLVRVVEVDVAAIDEVFFRITAIIQNQGLLPTYVTEQALRAEVAETVRVTISMEGADRVGGEEVVDLGHLPGSSSAKKVEWVVQTSSRNPTAIIKAISQKGGTHSREVSIDDDEVQPR